MTQRGDPVSFEGGGYRGFQLTKNSSALIKNKTQTAVINILNLHILIMT